MQENDLKIGLAFSGGGYRAASFSLGVLSYLNKIKIKDESLLKKVIALSTVSGGTITGTKYAIDIKKGESFDAIYKSLYDFMSQTDLINLSLDNLISPKNWRKNRVKSLINAVSDVYDRELFRGDTFGVLLTDENPTHLKHISFNATEFANAAQFRFQRSEKIINPREDEPERGIIGNYYYQIPEHIARNVRMSDILAASSCFPGGFEPINFPDDFQITVSAEELNVSFKEGILPVGLMDGGIVDNQGIEPLLLAEARMKRNRDSENLTNDSTNVFDLLIISDVASPYMEEYVASVQKEERSWRRWTPIAIFRINTFILIISLVALMISIILSNIFFVVLCTIIATMCCAVFILAKIISSFPQKFNVPDVFLRPLNKLLKLKLIVYENLIVNRSNSLLKMANEVFLKHVRRLNYDKIYDDPTWKNRRIMNAIYELRKGEKRLEGKIRYNSIDKNLIPSEKIQDIANKAASMGTTLWFTKEELAKENMLDSIIACGQFTTCWNLLEYIGKIKTNSENINDNHSMLIECEDELMKDWMAFQKNPLWMIDLINNKMNN